MKLNLKEYNGAIIPVRVKPVVPSSSHAHDENRVLLVLKDQPEVYISARKEDIHPESYYIESPADLAGVPTEFNYHVALAFMDACTDELVEFVVRRNANYEDLVSLVNLLLIYDDTGIETAFITASEVMEFPL